MSGGVLEPAGDGLPDTGPEVPRTTEVDLLAAALRADANDVDTYARVLTASLGEALPPGMVEVERDRSMKDRLAGRPGRATAIRVHGRDRSLELEAGRGQPVARIVREVRGVVIAREVVGIDVWLRQLADEVSAAAAGNAAARQALATFLEL